MTNRRIAVGIAAASLLFLLLGTILPMTTTEVFASPDETAVAAFARQGALGWVDGLRIPSGIDPMGSAATLSGLHPRSMVRQGVMLAPVGFLGMPMMLMPFEIVRGAGSFMTALLVLSSAYALFRLTESIGKRAAWSAVVTYLSFPVVLLYTNRGLFPNLPIVALGLWAVYLLWDRKETWASFIGGVALGLAVTIRPVEALWLLPWIVWAMWKRRPIKRTALVVVGAMMMCAFGYFLSVKTYGSWIPTIGYWARDAVSVVTPEVDVAHTNIVATSVVTPSSFLPFGIHPRAMWGNIQTLLFGIVGPWIAAALAGFALWMWSHRNRHTPVIAPSVLTGWTIIVLFVMYGQARYTDNINGTATIGNSFLRYLLPLVPLMAIGVGLLVEELWQREIRWKVLAIGLVTFFATFGIVQALVRDEEAIIPTRAQLERYLYIREVTHGALPPGTIVLSERSDKIFVGMPNVVAVSPLPDPATMDALIASGQPIALFHRILTDEQREAFANGVFRDWLLASVFENEGLYILPAMHPNP